MGAGPSQELPASAEKYKDKIDEVKKLLETEDPDEEPYRSKYKAVEILKEILNELTARSKETLPEEELKDIKINIALVELKLGAINIETEEMHHGEKNLNDALVTLESIWPEHALDTIYCLNQIGILWNNRTDHKQSEKYLKNAEARYTQLDLATYDDATRENIEDQHTLTLFYLAQMYGHAKNTIASADYCRKTLQRQLKSKKYDPDEFVSHCLALAGYYEAENMLSHVRQCVEAAMIICEENPDKIKDKEQLDANLALIWGRYFLAHLTAAKKHHAHRHAPDEILFEEFVNKHPKMTWDPEVPKLETYDQAAQLYLKALDCFNRAKKYYVLDGFVSDHLNVLQDISHVYKALTAFETDPDRICKLIRRRIDLIEPIIPQLNPQHFPFVLMQNTFRLGELYSELADMKIKIMDQGDNPTGHQIKKINELLNKAIKHYTSFLKMFEVKGKEPEQIEPEQLEAYLMARFSLARLYSRLISEHPEVLVKTLKQSLAQYEWVTQYADKHPEEHTFDAEISVCRQMAQLLPMKIQNIARSARNVGE